MRRGTLSLAVVASLVTVASIDAQDQGAQLRRALFAANTSQVASLASSKAIANSSDTDGVTPLMIAAALGQTQAVKTLLAAGALVEAQTKDDKVSALIFAADLGHLDAVQALVDGGATVQATDQQGYSAIDYAIIANAGYTKSDSDRTVAVAKYLQSKGAALKKDSSGLGTGVGSALGNLLAIGGQADLKKLMEKARATAK